jgi:hypothetical protein
MHPHPSPNSRSTFRRRSIIAAVVAGLVLATGLAWGAGLLRPRLELGGNAEYGADRGTIFYGFRVRNAGYSPLTIVGVGRGGAGLELTSVDGQLPVTLGRGEETWIKLRYRVTDCGAVTSGPWPVPVTVTRLWGAQTIQLALPTQRQSQWRGRDLPALTVVRSGPVEWQQNQADMACALLH